MRARDVLHWAAVACNLLLFFWAGQLRQFMDVGAKPDAHAWKFPASTVNAW